MESLIMGIMLTAIPYIEDRTEYVYQGEPLPQVQFVPDDLMAIEYYGPEVVARAEYENSYLPEILAFYDHDEDSMYLLESFDPETDDYVVFHEMVHYLQDINGEMEAENYCRGNLEVPAYEVSDAFLEETGREDLQSNGLFVALLAAECNSPHP